MSAPKFTPCPCCHEEPMFPRRCHDCGKTFCETCLIARPLPDRHGNRDAVCDPCDWKRAAPCNSYAEESARSALGKAGGA